MADFPTIANNTGTGPIAETDSEVSQPEPSIYEVQKILGEQTGVSPHELRTFDIFEISDKAEGANTNRVRDLNRSADNSFGMRYTEQELAAKALELAVNNNDVIDKTDHIHLVEISNENGVMYAVVRRGNFLTIRSEFESVLTPEALSVWNIGPSFDSGLEFRDRTVN